MQFVLATLVILPVAALVIGAISGRVRARSCCSVPAERDLRLRP